MHLSILELLLTIVSYQLDSHRPTILQWFSSKAVQDTSEFGTAVSLGSGWVCVIPALIALLQIDVCVAGIVTMFMLVSRLYSVNWMAVLFKEKIR